MSISYHLPDSTPIGPNLQTGLFKESVTSDQAIIPVPPVEEEFVQNHLKNAELVAPKEWDNVWKNELRAITAASSETGMYRPLARLLNYLSERAFSTFFGKSQMASQSAEQSERTARAVSRALRRDSSLPGPSRTGRQIQEPAASHQHAIIFAPWPNHAPNQDSFNTDLKPDIHVYMSTLDDLQTSTAFLGTPAASSERSRQNFLGTCKSWSQLESALEAKPHTQNGWLQASHYSDTLLRYRSDKSYVLSMAANQKGFRLFYTDAFGGKCSEEYSWRTANAVRLLFKFVLTFYYFQESRDATMMYLNPSTKHPRWSLSMSGGNYQVIPIFTRKGAGRRTWIALGTETGSSDSRGNLIIAKDMWRDEARRFEEDVLLEKAHLNGFIPGVVRLANKMHLDLNVTEGKQQRTKRRIIMGSSGSPLSSCTSVLHFLKVIYDAVEGIYIPFVPYTFIYSTERSTSTSFRSRSSPSGYELVQFAL